MTARPMTRSRDKKLMGVAGGIAEYLDMDKTVWRAIWVFAAITFPPLALAYLILGLVMPDAPAPTWQPAPPPQGPVIDVEPVQPAAQAEQQAGGATFTSGTAPEGEAFQSGSTFQGGSGFQGGSTFQGAGAPQGGPAYTRDAYKPLTKSRDKWLAGVCGGIAEYFNVDPVLVRALWLAAVFFFGTGLLLYIILAILMPQPVHQTRS